MKKTLLIFTITIITTQTTFGMKDGVKDALTQLSPRGGRKSKESLSPKACILANALKAESLQKLLTITYNAQKKHDMCPKKIGDYAITQDKQNFHHRLLCIKMERIAQYHQKIQEINKSCPVTALYNQFDSIMPLYKKYREARICAENCGLHISINQQHQAIPYPSNTWNTLPTLSTIAFEEYIELEDDLTELSKQPLIWDKIISMITSPDKPRDTTSITLETDQDETK